MPDLSHRAALAAAMLSAALVSARSNAQAPAAAAPTLQIAQGQVSGTLAAEGKVHVFRGIPYAAPPVGKLRWQPPQPAKKFHGVFQATDYGHRCIQTSPFQDMVFHDPGQSEDCLSLNIWTPAGAQTGNQPDAKLPVMVWVYGGGFTAGSTSEARQDGQFLAQRNVVVVTLNYRLGILGFFAHPQLTAESPHHASGNYGLLDQAAALAWVKENIGAFGGDPANLTIFGESAGSFSVSSQMASPLSRGLLAHAIGESGAAFASTGLPYPALAEAEATDAKFAQDAFGTSKLKDLRKLTADQLVTAASSKTSHPPRFGPDVDGWFLPKPVADIYAAGEQAHIPTLGGWNADEVREGVLKAPTPPTAASFQAQARVQYGADADAFLAAYPATTDEEALRSAGDLADDRFIAFSTWRWLEAQVKTGQAPVYRYRFDLPAPASTFHPGGLAWHSDEIEYVFGTLDSRPGATWRPADRSLSDLMMSYWSNFARTGDPNGSDAEGKPLPAWPHYGPTAWDVMHLDAPASQAKTDTERARYLFLEAHPFKVTP